MKSSATAWTAAPAKSCGPCDLPGSEDSTYAYGFSDSSTPSPVTDGKHVWFFNSSGSVGCWDYKGKPLWLRQWKPTGGRPFNKQFEPMLVGDTLVNMEPRDEDDPKRERKTPGTTCAGWTKYTGKTLWVSDDALTHYNTPVMGTLPDGTPAVLAGARRLPRRAGNAHRPDPDQPRARQEGKTLWRFEAKGKALYNMHWDKQYAYWFNSDASEHIVIDTRNGKWIKTQSPDCKVDYAATTRPPANMFCKPTLT